MPSRIALLAFVWMAGVMLAPIQVKADTLADIIASNAGTEAAVSDWKTTVTFAAASLPEDGRSWPAAVTARASNRTSRRGEPAFYTTAGSRVTGEPHSLDGLASYYWQGQVTATGEPFDKRAMTAAHRTLPFGTKVRVTREDNGSSVVVRINDRGPFKAGRVIDLSERAAEDLGMTTIGLTPVRLEVLAP